MLVFEEYLRSIFFNLVMLVFFVCRRVGGEFCRLIILGEGRG